AGGARTRGLRGGAEPLRRVTCRDDQRLGAGGGGPDGGGPRRGPRWLRALHRDGEATPVRVPPLPPRRRARVRGQRGGGARRARRRQGRRAGRGGVGVAWGDPPPARPAAL